ncbi:MAG: DMT family transporter [Treponema sp.]|nr:DMT family transporter [Treponema sp.]
MTGEIFALASAVFWSLHMVHAKKAQNKNLGSANPIDPTIGLFITILVNNVINCFVLIARYALWPPIPLHPYSVLFNATAGVFNSLAGRGMLFSSVAILGAAKAGFTRSTMPVFVLLGGVLLLGERLSARTLLGIGIVLLALFLMSFDAIRKESSAQTARLGDEKKLSPLDLMKGIAFGLASAMFIASGNVLRKAAIPAMPDVTLVVFIGAFSALSVCAIILIVKRKVPATIAAIRHIEFNYMMSGVFASFAQYTMVYSLSIIPVAVTNSIGATEPLFTILFVWLIKEGKKEKIGIQTVIFAVIMVIGTIILVTSGS